MGWQAFYSQGVLSHHRVNVVDKRSDESLPDYATKVSTGTELMGIKTYLVQIPVERAIDFHRWLATTDGISPILPETTDLQCPSCLARTGQAQWDQPRPNLKDPRKHKSKVVTIHCEVCGVFYTLKFKN